MRPVNLLPTRYRPARATGARAGVAYIVIGALAVLLVMVVAWVVTQNGINDAEEKTAEAQAEQQAAQARAGALAAYGNFAQLKTARENAVRGLAQVRFDYERLMRETALLLPDDVYLTAFSAAAGGAEAGAETAQTSTAGAATATGPTVTLGGCAPTHPDVAATVVRLRKLHNAVDVNLQSSTAAGDSAAEAAGAVCRVAWNGTITMKAEDSSTAERDVPARLGGGQ